MMDKIISLPYKGLLLLIALCTLSACQRTYEPLPRDERQINPDAV